MEQPPPAHACGTQALGAAAGNGGDCCLLRAEVSAYAVYGVPAPPGPEVMALNATYTGGVTYATPGGATSYQQPPCATPDDAPSAPLEFQGVALEAAPVRRPAASAPILIPLCRKGDRAGIERQLQAAEASGVSLVGETDEEGNTPLHVAVEAPRNELATVQCLLEYGASANAANYLGAMPLHYVCLRKNNHRGIANILLENGAGIDVQTLAGKTALHFACEQHQPELVEVLCMFGAHPDLADSEGNTPLHSTVVKVGGRDTVKRQMMEQLMACGADFQTPNRQGLSPSHLSCRGGYIRCLHFLMERQANLVSGTCRGETPLLMACLHSHPEVVQLLLQVAPQVIDIPDVDGNTPLHACANAGSLDCALLLLRMGADANLKNKDRKTALELSHIRGTDLSSTHNPELEQALKDARKGGSCRQS